MIKLKYQMLIFFCFTSLAVFAAPSNKASNKTRIKVGKIRLTLPKTHLTAAELGVIINKADPLSVKIGEYYQVARKIPLENMIYINFTLKEKIPGYINVSQFNKIRAEIVKKTSKRIQAYAIAWRTPYRVGCMSMTSAVTFGYKTEHCSTRCKLTKKSPYYNSTSLKPFLHFGFRPSMLLAAKNFKQAKLLIDRGIKSDKSKPTGTAYLLNTKDKSRNVRKRFYPLIKKHFTNIFNLEEINSNFIENKNDVMFYFTGIVKVPKINQNRYLPGAMADHLTSTGGRLINLTQMPADLWLEAGATGSYGTVVEPCNFTSKFPNPFLAMLHYYKGSSLIEAYWKSVAMPGQGLFIGEPLASPFAGYRISRQGNNTYLHTQVLNKGEYALVEKIGISYKLIKRYKIETLIGPSKLEIPTLPEGNYQIVRLKPKVSPPSTTNK